jgi:hypothetical protein
MPFNQNIDRLKKLLQDFAVPRIMMTGQLTGDRKKLYQTTKVLTVSDSGALLQPVSGIAVYTLPLAADSEGVHFTFISGVAGAHVIKTTGLESTMYGAYTHNGGAFGTTYTRVAIDDKASLTHLVGSSLGDTLHFYSNGTNWMVEGHSHAALTQA